MYWSRRIGVVTTDDDHSLDVELAQNLKTLLKLVYLLQLGTAGTDHVEATGVAVIVNELWSELDILMVNKTARTHEEAIDLVLRVHLLHCVEDTADDIVTARCLTTGKDHTDIHLAVGRLLTGHKLDKRHPVSIREKLLDFFLVTYTLGRSSLFYADSTFEALRQLWLILGTGFLQKTLFHFRKFD